ncbi:MAG: inner membrane CreD family protein [Enterobacterales bacterium]|nr:inner membrane CreD family protein [Enterobacterales bacterium]
MKSAIKVIAHNGKQVFFSTDIENLIKDCFNDKCSTFFSTAFGVDQIEAVDIYLKGLRSVKYGILIVIITFTLLVLYEILQKTIRIHPISYSLTAMALAIFFLLLIAFSEHLYFASAYWISAFACSSLLGYYLGHIAGSKKQGVVIFSLLNAFYLILFLIIRSEDHALLSGSLLLFGLLTLVMSVTKQVDWYQLARDTEQNKG